LDELIVRDSRLITTIRYSGKIVDVLQKLLVVSYR